MSSEASDTVGQSQWLANVFGGARYLSADLRDFPTKQFTLSFWFHGGQDGTAVFLGDLDAGNSFDSVVTWMSIRISGGIELRFANWAEVSVGPRGGIADGDYHHFAMTFSQPTGSSQVAAALYIDGVRFPVSLPPLVNQVGAPIALVNGPLYIATRPPDRSQDNPIRSSNVFGGRVTDLRIWSRSMSDAEIADDMWNTVFGTEPGLYLAMPLTADAVNYAANTVLDLSPAHRDARAQIIIDDLQYLYFDRWFSAFPVDSRTVEMWVRCGSDASSKVLLSYADVSSSDHPNDGGVPWVLANPSNLSINGAATGINLIDGQWHHVAIVVDASTNTDTAYLDGVQKYTGPRRNAGQLPGKPLLLGGQRASDASDQLYTGLMRDFRLWSTARTADQIWASAGGTAPADDPSLILKLFTAQPDATAAADSPKHFLSLESHETALGSMTADDPDTGVDLDDYTVVLLVRPRQAGAMFGRIATGPNGQHGFCVSCTDDGRVQVREQDGVQLRLTSSAAPSRTGVNLLDGNRHSVSFRCADDQCLILLDGNAVEIEQTTSTDAPRSIDVNSSAAVQIGGSDPREANASGRRFAGDVFFAAYWCIGLSVDDMHRAAFGLLDGLYTAMLGCWTFDGSLEDQSFFGDDLTMSSPAHFSPAAKALWTPSQTSSYRFHHIEGVAHRARDGRRDVSLAHAIEVPAGAAMFYGALTGRGQKLAPPSSVAVSLTDPSGTPYASETDSDALFVKLRETHLRAFVIKNPVAGRWKVQIQASAQDDFLFQAQVLPAADAPQAVQSALKALFGAQAPSNTARQRSITLPSFAQIGVAALVGVMGVAAVVGAVIGSPIVVPLLLLAGVATARLAEAAVVNLDHGDRENACNETAAQTLHRESVGTPIQGSQLLIIDSLKFPKPAMPDGPSRLNFEVPAGARSFSFHVLVDTGRVTIGGAMSLLLKSPKGQKIPTGGEPFLYDDQFKVTNSGLTQGYCAASIPISAAQAGDVSGVWEAKISLQGVDPAQVQTRLCVRMLPAGAPAPSSYTVPVNFFYVGTQWFEQYRVLFEDIPKFMNDAVFQQANIVLDCAPLEHLRDDAKAITSDLYSDATAQLVRDHSVAGAMNVYIVEEMQIQIQGDGSALGFAVMPGPQGFMSPYTCVFVRVQPPGKKPEPTALGLRIAHEMGHSFGLTHTSSCLDNQSLATNPDQERALALCNLALVERQAKDSDLKASIRSNLMYTALPGRRLNAQQQFILQHAPILTLLAKS